MKRLLGLLISIVFLFWISYWIESQTINTIEINETENINETSEKNEIKIKERLKFFLIILPAALADSINPCAFAVMLLLLSSILIKHRSYKKLFLAWSLFVFAIFISYLAIWIWLYKTLAFTESTFYLKLIAGSIWFLIWIFNIKEYFWQWKGFYFWVPQSWKPQMQKLINWVTSPIWAFFVWFLVSLFLLPCTSWPYITILSYMAAESAALQTWGYVYLFIYNLIFIIPFIAIIFIVWFGFKSIDSLTKFRKNNLGKIHLIIWLLMLLLAFYVLNDAFMWIPSLVF